MSEFWIVTRYGRHPVRGIIHAAGIAKSEAEIKAISLRLMRELLAQGANPADRPEVERGGKVPKDEDSCTP